MNNIPTVSVIIPVYGVEQFISKCLLSIQAQTFTDFECLVVNDGSPDNSIDVAKQTVGNDKRFIFLEKENGGLASARNFGLDFAKGEYVAFLDSDDYVEPEFLAKPLQRMQEEQSDICMMSINYVDEAGTVIKVRHNDVDAYVAMNDFLISKDTVTQYAWNKIYKREIFASIRFNEEVITYEDVYVNFRILYGRKISNVKTPLINYLQRAGTLSRDIKPTYLQDRLAITKVQEQFVNSHGLAESHRDYIKFTYLKTFVFFSIVRYARYSAKYNADINQFKKVLNRDYFTGRNILFMMKEEPKVGFSLLLFKLSPAVFKKFAGFWFRKHVA
ncbi:MAG: glycosyltransferase [Idiomarina sp.]|nr:glycosyltransferase [Idiomarina sp.]